MVPCGNSPKEFTVGQKGYMAKTQGVPSNEDLPRSVPSAHHGQHPRRCRFSERTSHEPSAHPDQPSPRSGEGDRYGVVQKAIAGITGNHACYHRFDI